MLRFLTSASFLMEKWIYLVLLGGQIGKFPVVFKSLIQGFL